MNLVRPLHGIPILIKNNIATDDKMETTAGSWALVGAKVPRDSTVAAKLRAAGAIILGKTNLSQWANWRSANSTNGWSAYGGQTTAAYYPLQDPSGSSSGSGVATSVGLALASLGSETDGSIVSPSSVNNLVGIKPTVGLVSRYLVIPISEHQDTVGPMARTVTDAAYLLQAIVGKDVNDNYTSAIPNIPDYLASLNYNSLRGARLGVPANIVAEYATNATAPEINAFNAAVKLMQAAGATIITTNLTAIESYSSGNESLVLETDFINDLATYLSELTYNPNEIHSLADLLNFTKSSPLEDYPDRDVSIWETALALGYNNTSPEAYAARQADAYLGGPAGLLGAVASYNLSAVVLPTSISSGYAAIVSAPIVTVPLGFYPADTPVVYNSRNTLVVSGPGTPFGLSFLGGLWTESTLISLAYAYEQRTHNRDRRQPYIIPNVEMGDVVTNSLGISL